jgi:carboxymethylenebutenolidase
MATHFPEIAACVDYYGRPMNKRINEKQPEHPMDRLQHLRGPVLGLFGEDDHTIPAEQAHQMDAELDRLGIPHKVIVYAGAGHAFLNHNRLDAYRPEIARQAWEETLRFLAETLGR